MWTRLAVYNVNKLGFTFGLGDDEGGIADCLISNRSFREAYGNVGLLLY